MKRAQTEVKSKSQVVGVAEYEVFDSTQDAVDFLGEATVLDLINSQHRTNALNLVRARETGKPSKASLNTAALARITTEEFASIAGDVVALNSLIARKVVEVEKELEEKRRRAQAELAAKLAEEEDEEAEDR